MKAIRFISVFLLLAIAIGALVAGYLFITDATGRSMNISLDILRYSPFATFFIPGIILFMVNGLMNLFAVFFTLIKVKKYYIFISLQGMLLIVWILVQVMMLRTFNFLHLICLMTGISVYFFGWVLKQYELNNYEY